MLPSSFELNIPDFSHIFDNKSECYKLFWFKAIMRSIETGHRTASFETLIDEMIADAGCGSGRDLKFFREHGRDAEGIDASEELCRLAEEYSGCKVTRCRMEDFSPDKKYDGIWCCASLLHLEDGAVIEFFRKCQEWLTDGGILFLSVKTGIPTGEDEKGRWFRNFDEGKIRELLVECPRLHLERVFYTEDKTGRRGWKWMNALIRKPIF